MTGTAPAQKSPPRPLLGPEAPRERAPGRGREWLSQNARCSAMRSKSSALAALPAPAPVRVADGEPGSELQVDFGKMGLVPERGLRPQKGVPVAHFHRLLLPTPFCLAELPPEHRFRDRRFEAAWGFSATSSRSSSSTTSPPSSSGPIP